MIVTPTQLAQMTGLSPADSDAVVSVSVIVFALLLVLLVQHEVLRSFVGPRSKLGMMALRVFIAPLLFAFAFVAILRLVTLLRF